MNPPTIIILSIIGLIVIGIIIKAVINKKQGKGGCSCGCGGCANKSFCHPEKNNQEKKNGEQADTNKESANISSSAS